MMYMFQKGLLISLSKEEINYRVIDKVKGMIEIISFSLFVFIAKKIYNISKGCDNHEYKDICNRR